MGTRKAMIDGFPIVHSSIQIPDLAEYIKMPSFDKLDIELAYKHGGDVIKYLIDNAPLKFDKKYISVWSMVQALRVGDSSIRFRHEWHVDGNGCPFDGDDRYFIIMNNCTARTEFNTNRIEHYIDEGMNHPEYDKYLESNADAIGLVPKMVQAESYIEFNSNSVHRATSPKKDEFRLLFRIGESDTTVPNALQGIQNHSSVFTEKEGKRKSIEQMGNGVIHIYI